MDVELSDVEFPGNISREEFLLVVSVDEDLETTGELTDEELVIAAKRRRGDQEEDEAEMEEQVEQEPTVNEIISALRIVRKFSQKNNLVKEIESLRSIENKCQAEQLANKRQKSITSFLL